jgi:hypothetical protein
MEKGPFSGVNPQLVREWKAGYDEHNRFVLEERRNASYQDRFQSLTAIWRQAAYLGIAKSDDYNLTVNDTWQRLRQVYCERHG